MKLKIEGFALLTGERGIRIDATKTDWDDLPYLDENGEWQNNDKMFHVAMLFDENPIIMGETLHTAIQSLMNLMESN